MLSMISCCVCVCVWHEIPVLASLLFSHRATLKPDLKVQNEPVSGTPGGSVDPPHPSLVDPLVGFIYPSDWLDTPPL